MTEHKFVVGIFRLSNDGHFEMFAVFRSSNVACSLESLDILKCSLFSVYRMLNAVLNPMRLNEYKG